MKNRFAFLVIAPKTGAQKRFSINKYLMYSILIFFLLFLCSGIIGAWKYRENMVIRKKYLLLEAKKGQLETVARNVKEIEKEESAIRELLGLEDIETQKKAP